jgi:hypothetical protein
VAVSASPSIVEGRLEGVVDGRVLGWAWSPDSPNERIWVSVFVDDEPIGLTAADLQRPDLLAAGFGDGAHGFSIELPAKLRGDAEHSVAERSVRVMAGRSNTPLPAASDLIQNIRIAASVQPPPGPSFVTPVPMPPVAVPIQEERSTNGWRIPVNGAWTSAQGAPMTAIASLRDTPARDLLWRYGPQVVLAVGLVANFILLLITTRHLGFFQDDFLFILDKRDWGPHTFLAAINGHLSLMPVAIFKLLFLLVGVAHSWPYRLVLVAIDSACVVLLYRLVAARAGRAIALAPACLLLLLGSGTGSIDLVWVTQIGFLLSLAAGAAALMCLTRDDQTRDRAAAVLLAVSLASSSPSLAMCAGALAYLWAVGAESRRYRAVLWPLALYALWYTGYGTQGLDIANIPKAPEYLVQIASTSFGALAGLRGPARMDGFGAALLLVAVATLAWRIRQGRPFPPLALAGITGAATFWILAALTRAQTGNAASLRYLYPSAVFILIAFGGLLGWHKVTLRTAALLACALLLVGLGDLEVLSKTVQGRAKLDGQVRVVLGAADVIGPAGDPAFKPNPPFVPYLRLGSYLDAVRQLGSPAFAPAQIETQSPTNRLLADRTIIAGEQIGLWLPPRLAGATAPTVEKSDAIALATSLRGGATCTTATPTAADASLDLTVAPGRALYLSPIGIGSVTLYARRLAATYPREPLGALPSTDGPRGLGFPVDASRLPWHVQLAPTTPFLVCQSATATQ